MSNVINYLSLGSDRAIRLQGLQDSTTQAYLSSATVTATVKDSNGTIIASGITCAFIAGTNGDYVGNLPDDIALTEGEKYTIEAVADDGPGRKRTFAVTAIAAYTN